MTASTIKKIDNLRLLIVPLIVIAKIVRHTIMYERLVLTGRGWDYIPFINEGNHHFRLNVFDFESASGSIVSVAEHNAKVLAECFNIYGLTTTYYGWEIFITIVFNFLLYKVIVIYYKSHPFVTQKETFFIYLNIVVLNIFCFCMAKEYFQMIFWFVAMWALKGTMSKRMGIVKVAIALALTVLFTRKYYGLVFIYFLLVDFFVDYVFGRTNALRKSKIKLVFKVVLVLAIMAGMYYIISTVVQFEAEDTYQELERANSTDRGGNASSTIYPIFDRGGGTWVMTAEYFIKIFRLMFPVELLARFKPTYLVFIVYQGMLFYFLLVALRRRRINPVERNLATDLYIAIWLTSAAFEPDFGSWIRHQSVALPAMLYMLGGDVIPQKPKRLRRLR